MFIFTSRCFCLFLILWLILNFELKPLFLFNAVIFKWRLHCQYDINFDFLLVSKHIKIMWVGDGKKIKTWIYCKESNQIKLETIKNAKRKQTIRCGFQHSFWKMKGMSRCIEIVSIFGLAPAVHLDFRILIHSHMKKRPDLFSISVNRASIKRLKRP